MATGTLDLRDHRDLMYETIVAEIRSWAELPRRIFTQFHYAGESVQEIASQLGCSRREVLGILQAYDLKLRKSLRVFRAA